jgi:hypothetical protein
LTIDYKFLCSQVCNVHRNILGAWVIESSEEIHSFVKPGKPIPREDEIQKMFWQALLMVSMADTNKTMYGNVHSITIRHEKLDAMLFPLEQNIILAIGCAKPYD